MSFTLKSKGEASANLRIGTQERILRGRWSSNASGQPEKLELIFHAQKLEEAIDLGTPKDARKELERILNLASDVADDQTQFQKAIQEQFKSLIELSNIPQDPLGLSDFFKNLQKVLKYMAGIVKDAPEVAEVRTWITDFVFKGHISSNAPSSSLPPGEITLGLAFEFEDMKLLNIELVSAGIQFTATISS